MIELIQMPDAAPRILQKMNELASEVNKDLTDGNVTAKRNVLQTILKRITIEPNGFRFEFDQADIRRFLLGDPEADFPPIEGHAVQEVWKPIQLKRRGIEAKLVLGGDNSATRDRSETCSGRRQFSDAEHRPEADQNDRQRPLLV